ncbi:hypothetical protein HF847_00155 [Clostridium cochlearium]|uniref:hypothetical protein n=1 Tax=Clostridium cochlearium TaxID=1494 RepID=UPI0014592A47|nr:hypothetical protein [Clostridium cochlearium]NME94426.1 hypothetical protein [Clostridium cochlearium]
MTPLMSFWPSIYEKISNQIKLIEYRRTFPKDCKFAYMYVSKPVKAVCGILYFGEKHTLSDWKEKYSNSLEISTRIDEYLENYRYGMEIKGFQKIQPITLDDLRKNVPRFVAPQSYLLLENNKNLADYLERNIVLVGEKIENDFSNAYPEHVCKRY